MLLFIKKKLGGKVLWLPHLNSAFKNPQETTVTHRPVDPKKIQKRKEKPTRIPRFKNKQALGFWNLLPAQV